MVALRCKTGLLLIIFAFVTMFFGTVAFGETTGLTDLPDEPEPAAAVKGDSVELHWYLPGVEPYGFDEVNRKLNEHLLVQTGDTVVFNFLSWDTFENKKNLLFASGEQIDLIFSANWLSYENNAKSGYYYPLNDIIDKLAPKSKAVLGDSILKAAMVDGELFALPVPGEASAYSSGLLFRKDLVDKYKINLSKIKKLEDVEPILKLIKIKQPNVIPLVNCSTYGPFYDQSDLQSMGYDDRVPGALSYNLKDNKVYNEFASQGTMNFFKTLHKFNKAGYLKKYDDQDDEELFCKLMSNNNPTYGGYYKRHNWIFVNIGKPILAKHGATSSMNSVWSYSRYPEHALSVMEYINNDAVSSNLLHFGIEGKHYVKVLDNVIDYPSGASIANPAYDQNINWMVGNRYLDFTWRDEDPDMYKKLKDYNKTASISRVIGFEFNASPVKTEISSCREQVEKYIEGLMDGEYDPVKYLPILNTELEKAGVNKLIAEKQKQFDAWVEDQAALKLQNTSGIKLLLDGKPLTLKYPPTFSKGVPMVPMKQIFDSLDALSEYDAKTKTITASKNENSLKLTLGDSTGNLNGDNIKLAAPPELIHGQVYVSLETACGYMGFEYNWNASEKIAEINRRFIEGNGNTWGNIANDGFVVSDDKWQYISMRDGIYRLRNDGSGITKLSDSPGYYLNIAGEWLYYSDRGAKSWTEHLNVITIKTDGSSRAILTTDAAICLNLMGEWLYYINGSDGYKPYRINIHGGKSQKLSDIAVSSLYVDNGWLYYQKSSDKNIYRMRTSGTDVMRLTNTVGVDNRIIDLQGDWIYYSGAAGSMHGICKMKSDGSGKKFIVDIDYDTINMDEANIFCNNSGDLYRIDEGKREKIKIWADAGYEINVCGDWIYYTNYAGNEVYRISKDGTVVQSIELGKSGKVTDIFRLPALGSYTPMPIRIPDASSGYTTKTAKEIVRQKNAVVLVKALDDKGNLIASGSGFNIESTGTVVTNFHVIKRASAIKCSFDNGKTYDTDFILNYSYIKDIAILKLKGASGLPVVRLGNSDKVELADDVIAIGNPMNMQNTISDGLVSGIRNMFGIRYIQTTASISGGSSGGPLFGMNGEVIGMTSLTLLGSQNMNFAVPINSVRKLLPSAQRIPIQAVNNYDIEVVEFEDNDSIALANSLQMDRVILASLHNSRDVDAFKFEMKSSGSVTFTGGFEDDDEGRVLEIRLLDRNGAVLIKSEDAYYEEENLQTLKADLKAGTYYISVSCKPLSNSSVEGIMEYYILCIEN